MHNYFKTLSNIFRKKIQYLHGVLINYEFCYDLKKNQNIIKKIYDKVESNLYLEDEFKRLTSRSFAQFLGQAAQRKLRSLIIVEIISIFYLPILVIRCLINNKKTQQKTHDGKGILLSHHDPKTTTAIVIPECFKKDKVSICIENEKSLSFSDLKLLTKAFLYSFKIKPFFNFQFFVKIIKEISWIKPHIYYDGNIEYALIHKEYDCALSMITLFLHKHNIKLYNVMHGDKFFYSGDAFWEVDKCYCLDKYYIDLFKQYHVKTEFLLFNHPDFIRVEKNTDDNKSDNNTIGIIMPLEQNFPNEGKEFYKNFILEFTNCVNELSKSYKIVLRPHPLYKDEISNYKKHLNGHIKIELPCSKKPSEFIADNKIIIGVFSTMLLAAAYQGKEIYIIDNHINKQISGYHILNKFDTVKTVENIQELKHNIKI